MIRERVNAGLPRRASGKRRGHPRVGDAIEAEIRAELASGKGLRKVARALGRGNSTVQRVKARWWRRNADCWSRDPPPFRSLPIPSENYTCGPAM
jgi:DNA invertase Pin-like site-specific DNA recombinase